MRQDVTISFGRGLDYGAVPDRACSCPVAAGRPIVPGRVSRALGFWQGLPPTARVATMMDEADRAYRRALSRVAMRRPVRGMIPAYR